MEQLHLLLEREEKREITTTTLKIANNIGLKGFVRNLENGKTEIVAEGNREQLHKLVDWAKMEITQDKEGAVSSTIHSYEGTYKHFDIL